jgi:hypothetical protein
MLTATKSRAEVNHGSTEYWIAYAEDTLSRTGSDRPWFSEIKCAEIGLEYLAGQGNPRAIELKNLLWKKREYVRVNEVKIYHPENPK